MFGSFGLFYGFQEKIYIFSIPIGNLQYESMNVNIKKQKKSRVSSCERSAGCGQS
jgi:positive regulator of sigma E activity